MGTALMSGLSVWILREYFRTFLNPKEKTWKNFVIWLLFFIWQIGIISRKTGLSEYAVLIGNIILITAIALTYKGSLVQKVFFAVIYNCVGVLMEFVVGSIFLSTGAAYDSREVLGSLLSKLLLLMLVKILQRFFRNEKILDLPNSYSMSLILIPLGSMYVVYNSFMLSSKAGGQTYVSQSFVALLIMLVLNVVIFRVYLKLSKDLELRQENIMYKQEVELYEKHIKEKENAMLEFRKAKHDLRNQMIYVLELSKTGNYTELEDFLTNLSNMKSFHGVTIADTGNLVVDTLINDKYAIAGYYGIHFQAKLNIPTKIPFHDGDICMILGNALDNAIEANMSENGEKRYINVSMRMDRSNLILVIENSFYGEIKRNKAGRILTMKEDVDSHGFGLNSIKKAVDKYHGLFKIDIRDKEFQLRIVLYADREKLHT